MIELWGLWLLRPWWLLVLPVTVALAWPLPGARDGLGRWREVLDPALLPALAELGHIVPGRGRGKGPLLAAAAAALALGLAGPATRSPSTPAFRNLDIVHLLVDLSDSVTRGGALGDAQAAAALLLREAEGRPLALTFFAGDAYEASAPTTDPVQLQTAVSVMAEGIVPDQGSRPERALAMARKALEDADARGGHVVLISDGGGVEAEALHEAALIANAGGRVSAVYVRPSRDVFGVPEPSPAALEALAKAGQGRVFPAAAAADAAAWLAAESPGAVRDHDIAALVFRDHGRWLVLAALLPLAIAFRRERSA